MVAIVLHPPCIQFLLGSVLALIMKRWAKETPPFPHRANRLPDNTAFSEEQQWWPALTLRMESVYVYSQILMNMTHNSLIHNSLALRDREERQEHSGGTGEREKGRRNNSNSVGTLSLSKTRYDRTFSSITLCRFCASQ